MMNDCNTIQEPDHYPEPEADPEPEPELEPPPEPEPEPKEEVVENDEKTEEVVQSPKWCRTCGSGHSTCCKLSSIVHTFVYLDTLK